MLEYELGRSGNVVFRQIYTISLLIAKCNMLAICYCKI